MWRQGGTMQCIGSIWARIRTLSIYMVPVLRGNSPISIYMVPVVRRHSPI